MRRRREPGASRILWVLGLLLVVSQFVDAERLPIKTYTTADGLAHNNVNRIVRDSRGFLWFCTFEGLSRFDGYSFTSYGVEQGLPSPVINDLLEAREGQYWVATEAGLCRFNPNGRAQANSANARPLAASSVMFTVCLPGEDAKSKEVTSLLQTRDGVIWCGTAGGLYRLEQRDEQAVFRLVELGMLHDYKSDSYVTCMAEDKKGALWIGSVRGIYRLLPDGRAERYDDRHGLPNAHVHCLLEDREGRLWAGTRLGGLCRLVPDPDPRRPVVARVYSTRDGLPTRWMNQIFQSSDGSLWAAASGGLIRFIPTADGRDFHFRAYAEPHGLSSNEVKALADDRNGNLWLGMVNGGAAKLARSGITAFGEADGFKGARAIFKDKAEELNVITVPNKREYLINRFDGERFTSFRLKFPQLTYFGWGWNQLLLQDRTGEWWCATGGGLYRFPRANSTDQLARTRPKAIYTTRNGLPSIDILRLFEDSLGEIWVGTANGGGLSRWDRATDTFYSYTEQDGLPSLASSYPISFAEDRAGNIWIGFSIGGGLVRYSNGRFTRFTSADGLPEGGIFNLYLDSRGGLWVPTTRGGACRVDHPESELPVIVTYTNGNGLSSNDVKAVTEDRWGRIYLATGRGIDRLDPATGNIRYYTASEGALLGDVNAAMADRDGALWFSYGRGLVRLIPEPDVPAIPPPVLITGLRIGGDAQPVVSALGESEVATMELAANRSQLQLDFVAVGFSPDEGLRYQYKLDGTGNNWSPTSDQRTVNFANLAPGRYRFLVRAINADGVMSEAPATFAFTILPPIWQRWWFITLITALAALVSYGLFRYRVTRLLEIERVRTRIAADLHDDIGSNLSQIAIWSDVAQRQAGTSRNDQDAWVVGDQMPAPLERIASTARETASAMSDIVWAINPRRDHLSDLTARMRRFAGEAFDSRDIDWQFDARQTDLSLGADTRREIFLIFKEGVNNIVRHSQCTRVDAMLTIEGTGLRLLIRDNGRGFDPSTQCEGHGLQNLRERAKKIGGMLDIRSAPGSGTTVEFQMPITQHRWRR